VAQKDCIFCKIAGGEIDSEIVYQDDRVVAFQDANPQAPVHILIIPRKHIPSLKDFSEEDFDLLADIHRVAVKLADKEGLTEEGFRLVNNCGSQGGQTVDHVHYHLLGGRQLTWPPG